MKLPQIKIPKIKILKFKRYKKEQLLLKEYEKGRVLQIDNNINNKEYLSDRK